ncbi:putative disease resistance protein At4g19050 isoform X2 [Benincasa hispida]|uniref:putative disease resistance protein At4g19050 isoform X2 n=1 Tax=Benincasa hispida TaxID=102211 RepID=UPI00190102C3|nr:putative disease resistance protein At4g19050 isoform X2 [Benincasa hispida]
MAKTSQSSVVEDNSNLSVNTISTAMDSETGQPAVAVSTQLSQMVADDVKSNPKFQKTAEIIIQNCGDNPTLNLVIAEALNHIAKHNEDDWTVERALEEIEGLCKSETSKRKEISLVRFGFDMLPRSDLAMINCCWHSRQFFRNNGGVHYNLLITNWILEECFGLVDHFDKAYHQGHDVLMNLINRGLLKIEENNDNVVVMEELVRDVPDSRFNGFVWKPTLGLSGVYEGEIWLGLDSVGPADGMIRTCEKDWKEVSVLLVDGNHLCQEVVETYFTTLKDLQVLAIFSPRIEALPVSLTKLGKLCFLVLKDCDLLENIDGLVNLKALTVLEISNAKNIKDIPKNLFESLSKLRSLNLSYTGIKNLPSSLSKLHELRSINLRGCCYLKSLPMLKTLVKLQLLDVSGATSLERLADKSINALQDLQLLDLSQTLVRHVPFLKDLKQLFRVSFRDCKELIRLPNLRGLSGLQVLDLSGALMLKEIQDDTFSENNDLKILDLSRTAVTCLPSSNCNLSNLELLNMSETLNLVELEDDTFKNMACLCHLDLSKSLFKKLPSLTGLVNLRELKLQECSNLVELPSLDALKKLEVLDLSGCVSFKAFKKDQSFSHMTNLQFLDLSETIIEKLPDLSDLHNLSQLLLRKCTKLTKLPPPVSLKLKVLDASGAENLREWEAELPEDLNQLEILDLSETKLSSPRLNNYTNLRHLSLRGELQTVLQLDNLTNLEVLDLSSTRISSSQIQTITKLSNLRQLLLTDCSEVQEIPTLEPLVKLEGLHLKGTKIKEFCCQMAKLTRLMHLDLPNSSDTLRLNWTGIKSLPGELNWDQFGMPSELQNSINRPSMIVRDMNSFKIMKAVPDIWNSCFNKFFISVCPLKKGEEDEEIYVHQDGTSYQDIYFHVMSYRHEYSPFLEIRRFESFPTGLEDALMKVEYVSFVEIRLITSLSKLGNANNLKGCWIWSCTNLECLMQKDKDQDNLNLLDNLEILWICNLPILKSVHSTGLQFESIRNLTQLYIDSCPQLVTLFKSSHLSKSLEILHVKFCDGLKSICESKEECTLEKLHSLNLLELPELTDIGLKLPSLRTANIRNCPKLGESFEEKLGLEEARVERNLIREQWDGSRINRNGEATSLRSL